MILNKKLKYILGSVGLLSLIGLPASLSLTSCSKKSDKIDYYKQADNAIFEGSYMGQEASTFMCDFNLTNKTCAIVDWVGNYPNYMTNGLPEREGLGSESLHSINNTVRIPSQVVYNGEIYTVVSFRSLKGAISTYKLNLGKINNYLIQVLEFDSGLSHLDGSVSVGDDDWLVIYYEGIRQPNLLKVLNYPYVGMNLSGSSKLSEITFNDVKASYPSMNNCTSLTSVNIPKNYNNVNEYYINNFQACTKLQSVTIGDGATEIIMYAFKDCTSLETINIPNTVTTIWDGAFENCTSLKNITIPESVTSFGNSIFYCSKPHSSDFKIYFHSQEQLDLFLQTNGHKEYCEVLKN